MPRITFSYPFKKLISDYYLIKTAKLLQVLPVDLSDITQEMIDFDTDFGKYSLPPKGAYLMLIFQKSAGDLFTTLRRETPAKREYYTRNIGQIFEIEVSVGETATA